MSEPAHILIAGGGRVGRRVASRFQNRGTAVTIVEKNRDEQTPGNPEIELIAGDATRPSVLKEGLRDDTTVVGALTDRGDTNLAVCMVASKLDVDVRTVARIEHEHGDEYEEFVDDVFFPERASIKAGMNALAGSNVRTIEEVTGDLEILDIQVGYDAHIKGERISEIGFPEGVIVISRTGGHVTAQHDEKMVAGRRYLVAADNDRVNEVIELFRGES